MRTQIRMVALIAALIAGTAGLAFAQKSGDNDEMRPGVSQHRHHAQGMNRDRDHDQDRDKAGSGSSTLRGGSGRDGGSRGGSAGDDEK